jgi:DDE superfamily endonuclease
VKNNVICDKSKRIIFLSKTYEGSKHDKSIIDAEEWKLPKGIVVHEDSGFEGHQQKGIIINRPMKKPKGRELTQKQKTANKRKASKRVLVEHSIGHIKIYRIVKDTIRLWKDNAKDVVMEICCGLSNWKIKYRT